MNKAYYYEIHRKTKELEEDYESSTDESFEIQKIHKDSLTGGAIVGKNLLNEYEIIDNDEFGNEIEEIVDLTANRNVNQTFMPNTNPKKLQLNLNATKIALKSQAAKIDKSITPETEVSAKRTQQQQHVPPLSFSIAPLDHVAAMQYNQGVRANDGESNNLPEIVLTSFEMRDNTMTTRHQLKKSATVTFQTITTTAPTVATASAANYVIKIPQPPPLPPPPTAPSLLAATATSNSSTPEANLRREQQQQTHRQPLTTTAIAEVYDRFRQDSEDSSEMNSQFGGGGGAGNSTSPESLMDNILSAASSVSVCDSSTNSLSSAPTDVTRLGVNICEAQVSDSRGGMRNVVDDNIINTTITSIEGTLSTDSEKELRVNSSLNSKSKSNERLQVSLTPFMFTTTTTMTTKATAAAATTSVATTAMSSPLAAIVANTAATLTTPAPPTRLIAESQSWLQPPELFETASLMRSRTPSPTASVSTRILPERALYPDELKCQICAEPFRDPRTLNCLHSFCFQCLVNENFKQDKSIPFWSQPNETNTIVPAIVTEDTEWKSSVKSNYSFRSLSPDTSGFSASEIGTPPTRQRRASFTFRRKKSQERILLKVKSDGRASESSSTMRLSTLPNEVEKEIEKETDQLRIVVCKTCNFATELPVGGLRQLPQNFLLMRKIEDIKLKAGDEIISRVFCSLCFEEINATYHCISCTLNLCSLCKEAHERQRSTANHRIKNIMELRRARKKQQNMLDDSTKFKLKCGMHPGFEIKSFCTVCLQVACTDCLVLLHKGHKHETIGKAIVNYSKILTAAVEQTRPLCNYAEHSLERLNAIARDINRKCDEIQSAVETFMQQYYEALEAHRKTLLQQVNRARESKVEMLLEQQMDLEKRTNETMEAMRFYQELRESASEVETLSFINILLKRFEYCQQFKAPLDPKISDSLHFLPKIIAPSTKDQNDILLYGIITMQTVEPAHCTLQVEGFSQLRLHKRVELTLLTRDADGVSLCHGGMLKQIQTQLKYKESSAKSLPIELSDNRDGTYIIAFTPDAQGTIMLTITINEKPIKGSPFTFLARAVRPHSGIYHCCAFCSSAKSKSNKAIKCSCEGRMPGYNGCGHGHAGHPGRRHWSCCGNVLENSECNVANKLLNSN